jgi:hypothetical protein
VPTYEFPESFYREFRKLPLGMQARFLRAVAELVTGLQPSPPELPPSLRVKRVQGHVGVWEMTFAADGRAPFEYGEPQRTGEAHVKWRRIGDHSILDRP